MVDHAFAGMYAALLTPLTLDLKLNVPMTQKLLTALMNQGLDGVYVAGTTGEGMRLAMPTRRQLVEEVVAALPAGKRLFVHVGTPDVRDAISLAEHAAKQGADAVSSLPPAAGSAEVLKFYEELTRHSPLPVIVYYFPKAAPEAFKTPQELLEIAGLPNVAGVKFTDFNVYLLNRLAKKGCTVFNGYDEALAAGLLMGAQGGIGTTYNLLGPAVLEISRAVAVGDWTRAQEMQSKVNDVLDILFRYPFFPAVREAVRCLGFDCGPMMSRDDFASQEERTRFHEDMDRNLPPEIAAMIAWPSVAVSR